MEYGKIKRHLIPLVFNFVMYLRNHCNIFGVDGGIHSKNGGKTA